MSQSRVKTITRLSTSATQSLTKGFFDGLTGLLVNPIWGQYSNPPANGSLTRDGTQLKINATAAGYVGGYVTRINFDPTHLWVQWYVKDATNLTKRLLISPIFTLTQDPAGLQEAYYLQTYGGANVTAFRLHNGVTTQVPGAGINAANLQLSMNMENGTIYFDDNAVNFASETYQITANPIYVYFLAYIGGAVPPLTAIVDNFTVIAVPKFIA